MLAAVDASSVVKRVFGANRQSVRLLFMALTPSLILSFALILFPELAIC